MPTYDQMIADLVELGLSEEQAGQIAIDSIRQQREREQGLRP